MDRFSQINSLLDIADEALPEIETLYKQSLSVQELDARLLVRIKNFLENLRSALEYLAQEIYSRFCSAAPGKQINVYFPILARTATSQDFVAFMNGRFPGLGESQPKVFANLHSLQFFYSPVNEWLVKFNDTCQENKHQQLSAQVRKQKSETRMTDLQGRTVSWTDGVEFGRGGSITINEGGTLEIGADANVELGPGGPLILGAPVDHSSQLPRTRDGDKIEKLIWVEFRFTAIGESALPFLKLSAKNVRAIVGSIQSEIETTSTN